MNDHWICDGCGKLIEGCSYATVGGDYFVPAKRFHIRCVPALTPQASIEDRVASLESQVKTLLTANGDFLLCIGGMIDRLRKLEKK